MSEMEHVTALLETHAAYMNRRMDQIHSAVLDSTQMIADHETRITVVEKREDKSSRWGAIGGIIGGFFSGLLSGKIT